VEIAAPAGIAAGPEGTVYVCGEKELAVFQSDGTLIRRYALELPARCLAVDAVGNVYLGLVDSVSVFAPDSGEFSAWSVLDNRSIVTSIAVDSDRVFVADAGTRVVWEFDTQGMLKGRIDEGFVIPSPYFDVAVDPSGSLWIADTGRHTLLRLVDGEVTEKWGRYAMDVSGFSGCCNPVHFAVLPDGRFVTTEKGLLRIKLHDADGGFAGMIAMGTSLGRGDQGLDVAAADSGDIYLLRGSGREIVLYRREGV
jgi:DNA-binding beta-propeller fold protein YncE